MCGIGGFLIRDSAKRIPNVDKMADEMLRRLQWRGGDATGLVALDADGLVDWQKAACDVPEFLRYRRSVEGARIVVCHTRYATQGIAAFPENNHPIRRGSVYLVHNGHVSNDVELFRKAKREPFGYVDSEALAALAAKYGITRLHAFGPLVQGAAAIAAVDHTRPTLLSLARISDSPLYVMDNGRIAVFGSTREAVWNTWKTGIGTPAKRNPSVEVDEGVALYFDTRTATVDRETFAVPERVFRYAGRSYSFDGWHEDEDTGTLLPRKTKTTKTPPTLVAVREPDTNECCDMCSTPFEGTGDAHEYDDGGMTWTLCEDCCRWAAHI